MNSKVLLLAVSILLLQAAFGAVQHAQSVQRSYLTYPGNMMRQHTMAYAIHLSASGIDPILTSSFLTTTLPNSTTAAYSNASAGLARTPANVASSATTTTTQLQDATSQSPSTTSTAPTSSMPVSPPTTASPPSSANSTTSPTSTALPTNTTKPNAASGGPASAQAYNRTGYLYDQQLLGQIGLSNNSESVTPLNSSQASAIISRVRQTTVSQAGAPAPGQLLQKPLNLSIENVSMSTDYGSVRDASTLKYFSAGTRVRYAILQNGNVVFINASVAKAPPAACIYLNLASSPICSNATTPAYIHVPVYRGHYGLTNQTWYPLNVTFKTSLIGSQTAPFNFSIIDLTNGTSLAPLTVVSTNSLNVSENFKVNVSDSIEITVGSAGNSNYSSQYTDPITTPVAIQYYVPVTLTNAQAAGIPNPSQINITVNSLAYRAYESSNLINIEFFYYNGTIVPSWLEGNALNSAQKADLYTSENTIYWLKVPGNFLPATSSNTLYMGFGPVSNSLMDGITTGEAPWLSPTYGQYDDGSGVFYYYNPARSGSRSGVIAAAPSVKPRHLASSGRTGKEE